MLRYTIEAKRTAVVPGLGVFRKGETKELQDAMIRSFNRVSGIPLNQAAMPPGLTLSIDIVPDEEA